MLAALIKENEKLHQENSVLFASKTRRSLDNSGMSGRGGAREEELSETLRASEAKIARCVFLAPR